MERKIILNLAMSVDGYISDEQGGYEWIVGHHDSAQDTINQFSFEDFMNSCDVVIMGRKAYEDNGVSHILEHGKKRIVVASKEARPNEAFVEFVVDPVEMVRGLKKEKGKNIWLYGGALLIEEFMKADLIDEYILGLIPVVLGKGRKLFRSQYPTVKLHLDEITVKDGVVISRYSRNSREGKENG
ncbi:MAG: dihydrofolate reductase [Clostridium sp.]|nr:dihydrofolate reductase [Clostridium sp.]